MKVRVHFVLKSLSMFLLFTFNVVLLTNSVSPAEQVVISPDKVKAPTFRTSDAVCYGVNSNTHINLGFEANFGVSVTGEPGKDWFGCTVGGGGSNTASNEGSTVGGGGGNTASGYGSTVGGGGSNTASGDYSTVGGGRSNTASNDYSTVGGGVGNTASGYGSTVGGGSYNTAAGAYSWAGGQDMRLENTAYHTFVWGYSDSGTSISAENAFLIFPAGTSGKVGIGTKDPDRHLTINGTTGAFLNVKGNNGSYEVLLGADNTGGILSTMTNHDLHLRAGGNSTKMTIKASGDVGIGITNPSYKLHVNGPAAGTSWTNLSSKDYKENIRKVDQKLYPPMLAKLINMDLVTYKYKKEYGGDGNTKLGFLAEDMPKEVLSKDGKGVDIYELITLTIGAIKAQEKENEMLRAENASLKRDIEKIKKILGSNRQHVKDISNNFSQPKACDTLGGRLAV